jgi:hypothetical protein
MAAIATLVRPPVAEGASAPLLGALEWRVVRLALAEADAGRGRPERPAGRVRRALAVAGRLLTGARPVAALADPRLEAVRRFVWAQRRNRPEAEGYGAALLDHGFSADQVRGMAMLSR